ncbi:hypothetical protein Ddye_017167 [Dipteronia dyeriana]|uniref:Transposase MuDR plant domain-containing protein n=1 Tax=Dipteronia dyeriana TaxID=168575 RepID=A0AAD9U8R2_9ROSI|nr:hypothetical protein Ddye_017167 [Dipteronia dyeriana]
MCLLIMKMTMLMLTMRYILVISMGQKMMLMMCHLVLMSISQQLLMSMVQLLLGQLMLGQLVLMSMCQLVKRLARELVEYSDAGEQVVEAEGEVEDLVESNYDQEVEDIAADTCVDPTNFWDTLQVLNIPPLDCGSGSDFEARSDELISLEGSDGEEVKQGPVRKFINARYHEFNQKTNMHDLVYEVGMLFASANIFVKAIRSYAVKHKRNVKFQKIDRNRVKVVYKLDGCK